jgi:uncharacterized protein (DUF2062 family)
MQVAGLCTAVDITAFQQQLKRSLQLETHVCHCASSRHAVAAVAAAGVLLLYALMYYVPTVGQFLRGSTSTGQQVSANLMPQ